MKTVLKIRWELILAILLLVAAVANWTLYAFNDASVQTLAVATMTTFGLMYIVIGFNTIAKFRHEAIKLWK